ncbi:phosphotransferase [Deinococcus peraridilitoris]|uniref:Putative aminoglycoside phosphotransferase n=1 Tax=Deinococcus peraridilitoris (strain DSM 19664 / LMG 22246 / CIP 109416 / KR-200) TaxID=937777 RepID=L0A9L7_DEIPD|nr:phosphotransferase [Deinococcus peraridilitoris]AFZ69750.1 putative aminoglycoside phosphotransferase [Deinococcus peraridilitoris DSM 19664]
MAAEHVPQHELTDAEITSIISTQFADLAQLRVTRLGEGTDHVAFDVGGQYIFRFPKRAEVAAALNVEVQLTAWLAPQLPLPIPEYRWFGQWGAHDVQLLAGYRRLPGTPALQVAHRPPPGVADSIGGFLRRLHDVSSEAAAELGVPVQEDAGEWPRVAVSDLRFAAHHQLVDEAHLGQWQDVLSSPPSSRGIRRRLLHGDFAAEHVLLGTNGAVSGVIDWSDAQLGDPALDLAGVLHWGGMALLHDVLETYGRVSERGMRRVRWYAACRALADIRFGMMQARGEYVRAGQRALEWSSR